jgi:hypothetical protein
MSRRHPRERSRGAQPPQAVGLAWYDAAQWAKLKQVAADTANLDDSYEDWQHNAERTERELTRRGVQLRRVAIDVDALVAWCRQRGMPINGEARAQYTAELVSRGGSA